MSPSAAAPERPYHHGNLRAALIDAGMELAREGGPEAVVVRAVSRRAGVSHNAAYRHFADRDALLGAVCDQCMNALARLMRERIGAVAEPESSLEGARLRLRATGRAYVEFALAEPGWFRTAFAVPVDVGEGPGELHSGADAEGPLQLLTARLDALAAAGGLTPERREHAELAAWSAVHGLSMLLLFGPLRALTALEREAALERVLATVERGI